jgi:hypothetical protein
MNCTVFTPRRNTEGVCFIPNIGFKQSANPIGIPRPWERPFQQVLEFHIQAERFFVTKFKRCAFSQSFHLRLRESARMGGIAQNLPAVEILLCFLGRSNVSNENDPALLTDALHLLEGGQRLQKMVKGKTCYHTVECLVGKRQTGRLPKLPIEICDLLFGLEPLRTLQHGGNDIQPGDMPDSFCEKARNNSRTTSDIEERVPCAHFSAIGHQLQQRIIAVRMPPDKRLCLLCELIEYFRFMIRNVHNIIMADMGSIQRHSATRGCGKRSPDLHNKIKGP